MNDGDDVVGDAGGTDVGGAVGAAVGLTLASASETDGPDVEHMLGVYDGRDPGQGASVEYALLNTKRELRLTC